MSFWSEASLSFPTFNHDSVKTEPRISAFCNDRVPCYQTKRLAEDNCNIWTSYRKQILEGTEEGTNKHTHRKTLVGRTRQEERRPASSISQRSARGRVHPRWHAGPQVQGWRSPPFQPEEAKHRIWGNRLRGNLGRTRAGKGIARFRLPASPADRWPPTARDTTHLGRGGDHSAAHPGSPPGNAVWKGWAIEGHCSVGKPGVRTWATRSRPTAAERSLADSALAW